MEELKSVDVLNGSDKELSSLGLKLMDDYWHSVHWNDLSFSRIN